MAIVILSGTDTSLAAVANYSTGALPSGGDTLVIRQRSANFTSNLGALSAIALAAIIVEATFTGQIGTGNTHATLNAAELTWAGAGSLALLDFGSNAVNITVQSTGSGATDGLEALRVKGSAIGSVWVLGGTVCIAGHQPTDTATVSALVVGSTGSGSPAVRIGVGTTITDIDVYAGSLVNDGASPSGAVRLLNAQAEYTPGLNADHSGTVIIEAGTMIDKTGGTITDLTVSGGVYDASQDPRPKTITDFTFSAGTFSQLNNVTFANSPTLSAVSYTVQ